MGDVCGVPVVSNVCDAAGDAAGTLVTAPFDWLAESMGNAAKWMFVAVWKVFDSTSLSTAFVHSAGRKCHEAKNVAVGSWCYWTAGNRTGRIRDCGRGLPTATAKAFQSCDCLQE